MSAQLSKSSTNGLTAFKDEVVISGISGRFPESNSIEEFKRQLLDGVDLVTDDDRRWPSGIYGLPTRTGKLKDLAHFDATFFGVHGKQANVMDPQVRLLLELTYEAIIDSGFNPADLRGSRTGVFIGITETNSIEYLSRDPENLIGYEATGCCKAIFPNRISYAYDFKGPSYAVDSACSSGLLAFQHAVNAIESGQCDSAIVGGCNLLLKPELSLIFLKLAMLGPEGICKPFDNSANGYARSEAVVVCILQKANVARRVYASILGAKTNTDGYKQQGITYPSGEMQYRLFRELYEEVGVSPIDVVYVETHCAGTKAGDREETNSIAEFFCQKRKSPLLIGSIKGNMGHAEPVAGLCSLVKVVIAMEAGIIPPTIYFKEPNKEIPALLDGRLKVVTKPEPWSGGIVGINAFGFGGTNTHVILKSNLKPKNVLLPCPLPRLLTVSGRTEEAVNKFLDTLEENRNDEELLALVDAIHSKNITGHNYRGFSVMGQTSKTREFSNTSPEKRPICFVFSGMGSQQPGVARNLMSVEVFCNSIKKCANALKPHRFNLEAVIATDCENVFENALNAFVYTTAVQIALVDFLAEVGIQPDIIIGHSVGEVACGYADGTLSAEQAIMVAYSRGTAILKSEISPGAVVVIGLPWKECKRRCPSGVVVACHNGHDSTTISGPPEAVNKFAEQLASEGVFTKAVKSFSLAFHSKYMADAVPRFKKALDEVIPVPRPRTKKWISTSVPENLWSTPLAAFSSSEYYANNLLSPVLFHEGLQHVPRNAVVIEIAPYALLQGLVKTTLGLDATVIALMKREQEDNAQFLFSNIGRIYNAGAQPKVGKLYSPVSFPVGRSTPMLNSIVGWDHSMEWSVPHFSTKNVRSSELMVNVDINTEKDHYLCGYAIDGRVIFHASGYLFLAWKTFAKLQNKDYQQMSVVMEDLLFRRATVIPKEGSIKFLINILEGSGDFEICEGGSIAVTGRIREFDDASKKTFFARSKAKPERDSLKLSNADIYTELGLRGYDYKGFFRGIIESDNCRNSGKLKWECNWVTFIDTMLQFWILGQDTRQPFLLTSLQMVIIKPKEHIQIASNLPKSEFIHVNVYRDIGTIVSGGIELGGMKGNLVPRRQVQESPKLEKYQFVPFEKNKLLSKDESKATTEALTVLLQLVLENSDGAVKLRVIEIVDEKRGKTHLEKFIKDILEAEPIIAVDYSVRSSNESFKDAPADKRVHLVVLSDVAREQRSNVLQNVDALLRSGGFLLTEELNRLSINKALFSLDWDVVSSQTIGNRVYTIFRKPIEISNDSVVVNITEKHFKWIEPVKQALKQSETEGIKVYLVTQGEELTGLIGMVNCLKQEPGVNNLRSFFIQDSNVETFSLSSPFYSKLLRKDLVHNVYKDGMWGSYRHILLDQLPERLQTEHAYMGMLIGGDLTNLKWIEHPLKYYTVEDKNLELCSVYYASLNFCDITPLETFPENLTSKETNVGVEFSGRDSTGRRVMGMVGTGSLATTVLADPELLWEVPEKWSLEEASTIPLAYGMGYYALIVCGRMQPGESVLIHIGSGDTEQASISIAFHMGCEVFTTVRSQNEKDFLKKKFRQLDDNHISSDRSISFQRMIVRQTKGQGVDVILNRLEEDKLHASVRCLACGGRFLQIDKEVTYSTSSLGGDACIGSNRICLKTLLAKNNPEKREIYKCVAEGIQNGVVMPLPSKVFGENQVEEAFRYRINDKYYDKVLLKIRDEECRKTLKPSPKIVSAIPRTYMNPNKSYILVGGLGGFGLELSNWIISRGAKKIVLNSRSGIKTGYQSLCVRCWQETGVKILISTIDATTEEGAIRLLEESNDLGPVGGIFNLAAVIKDADIQNQTEKDFEIVCKPKINATKYLDITSRKLTPQLDYFVVFSSIACGRGITGQSNYGFANSAIERICEARQAINLPGTAIQWAAIGDVGLFIRNMGDNDTELNGTLPQRVLSCLLTMDILLQQPNAVVASMVLGEKKSAEIGQIKLTDSVANILGIKDSKTIPATASLVDLGMDSLMGIEIKRTLERSCDVILSAQEIRVLTFGQLLKLEKGERSIVEILVVSGTKSR